MKVGTNGSTQYDYDLQAVFLNTTAYLTTWLQK